MQMKGEIIEPRPDAGLTHGSGASIRPAMASSRTCASSVKTIRAGAPSSRMPCARGYRAVDLDLRRNFTRRTERTALCVVSAVAKARWRRQPSTPARPGARNTRRSHNSEQSPHCRRPMTATLRRSPSPNASNVPNRRNMRRLSPARLGRDTRGAMSEAVGELVRRLLDMFAKRNTPVFAFYDAEIEWNAEGVSPARWTAWRACRPRTFEPWLRPAPGVEGHRLRARGRGRRGRPCRGPARNQRQWGRRSGIVTEVPPYGLVFTAATANRAVALLRHQETALEALGLSR